MVKLSPAHYSLLSSRTLFLLSVSKACRGPIGGVEDKREDSSVLILKKIKNRVIMYVYLLLREGKKMGEIVFYEDKEIKIGNKIIKYKDKIYNVDKISKVESKESSNSIGTAIFVIIFGMLIASSGNGLLVAFGVLAIIGGIIGIFRLMQGKKDTNYKIDVSFEGSREISIETKDHEHYQKLIKSFNDVVINSNKIVEVKDTQTFDSKYVALEKIKKLFDTGGLTEEEFQSEKIKILALN